MKYFISMVNTAILAGVFFMLFGCSSLQNKVSDDFHLEDAPVRVAILPFDLSSLNNKDRDIATVFRRIFYNHFSYLGYIDIDIDRVDEILAGNTLESTEELYLLSHDYVGKILGVDALIYCTIRKISNITAGIYAETSIEAELKMVDAHTGATLWEAVSTEIDVSGILSPNSLVTLIQKQIDNSKKREALIKIAEQFSKKVVKTIPDPAPLIAKNIHLPNIYSLQANINNKSDREGFTLEVFLSGEVDMTASFDIGDWKTDIPMQEESPGKYTGFYKVHSNDHLNKALIVGRLKDNNGLISKKIYEHGVVAFGTVY